jgi:DNA-binding transcriptional regulator GbsR (MarR family)
MRRPDTGDIAQPGTPKPERWQLEFVQRVAAVSEVSGMPPSHLSVLAWLIVCDPREQSVEQVRDALGLSAGAVSMATSALIGIGLIERIVPPGERRKYYRFQQGGFERILRRRLDAAATMRAIANEALAQAPAPPAVLAEMRDIYAWFEESMAGLLDGLSRRAAPLIEPGQRRL